MQLDKAVCKEFNHLLDSAVTKIRHCLDQLSEEQIWWRPDKEANSIGNLLLHISGNLRQWGIIPITGEPDQRDRHREFRADQGIGKGELMEIINATVAEANSVFSNLDETALLVESNIQGFRVTLLAAITHTTAHFVGHAHQIILLTRLQLGGRYRFHWSDESDRNDVPI